MTDILHLVTHSGAFHADEVFATAVLSSLFPDADVVRTRDPQVIARLGLSAASIIYDVGGRFDPNEAFFDHHQDGRPMRSGSGVPYSSFGLIWWHYGHDYLQKIHGIEPPVLYAVSFEIDRDFVTQIDAFDNGVPYPGQEALFSPISVVNTVAAMRPAFDDTDEEAETKCFEKAVAFAKTVLDAMVHRVLSDHRADVVVEMAIENRVDPRWIELPHSMPYDDAIRAREEADEIVFVICPAKGEWQLNTVIDEAGTFNSRRFLPEAWAGKRGQALVEETGIPDAVFCHAGRFIAVAKTRDGVMALLKQALGATA